MQTCDRACLCFVWFPAIVNGVDASRERAIGHFHRWETFGSPYDMGMGFRRVWETTREGAFALHMRVRVNNGENTLTFSLHLRAVYYEGNVEGGVL